LEVGGVAVTLEREDVCGRSWDLIDSLMGGKWMGLASSLWRDLTCTVFVRTQPQDWAAIRGI
jgi:hypothetical protein